MGILGQHFLRTHGEGDILKKGVPCPVIHILAEIGNPFLNIPRKGDILGRNQEEIEKVALLASPGSTLFLPEDFRGPTVIVREGDDAADVTVGEIIARYCQDEKDSYLINKQVLGGEETFFTVREKFPAEKLDAFRLG